MKSTIATIIGTAALGLLKRKIGSSFKIKRENSHFLIMPEMYLKSYATSLDYLGLDIQELYLFNPAYKDIREHRVFLVPVENSPVIKSVGFYLYDISISDEDENLGNLYDIYWTYVVETYDNDLVLDEQNLEHMTNISIDILSALQQALVKIVGNDVVYDGYDNEISPDNFERFMTYIGEPFIDNVHHLGRISEYFIIGKNGAKISLRKKVHSQRGEKPSKLRKR